MSPPDILVVGGGIAGLAAARSLSLRGLEVLLLERERQLCVHSSARNAAIWLPFDELATTPALAARSAAIFDELLGARERWLSAHGALLLARDDLSLASAARGLSASGLESREVDRSTAWQLAPCLADGLEVRCLQVPGAGVLDIHTMTGALTSAARGAGCRIRLGTAVTRIHERDGEIGGVELEGGEKIACPRVLVAGGAWAATLGASCRAGLPITPLRRHLVQLDAPPGQAGLTVWDLDEDLYFRPESDGVLASPCDEEVHEPCLPRAEVGSLDLLAHKLERVAPRLASAGVRRHWACLRTFAADRELVLGADPRVRGLWWFAGLGGRGMSVGAAAGEWCAALVCDESAVGSESTRAARLLGGIGTLWENASPPAAEAKRPAAP